MSRCIFCESTQPPDTYSMHAFCAMHYDCLLKLAEAGDEFAELVASNMKLVAVTCEQIESD